MSTYNMYTKHPKTGLWENALWEDDHFGRHHYGVGFPSEPGVFYDPWGVVPLVTTIDAEEAAYLNGRKTRAQINDENIYS